MVNYFKRRYLEYLKYRKFKKEFYYFRKLNINERLSCEWKNIFPCLYDNTQTTLFDAHYIYHPAWAARTVKKINPRFHVDISSLLSFATILSAFVETKFYDFRPAILNLSAFTSGKADLTNLCFASESIECISCMHTVEHIGLGRYGDKLDPEGDVKAINELKRVVIVGGSILFVVPLGIPRIQFNAHRVYNSKMIIELFSEFTLNEFSYINDNGDFISPAPIDIDSVQSYGCGCFWFIKNK